MMFKLSKLFICLSLLCIAIVSTSTLFPFIVGKYVWFRSMIDIAAIFFLLGLVIERDADVYLARLKRVFSHPVTVAVTVFTAVFLLAGAFGVNPANSFWSNFERGEGGFQMIHLYVFFLLLTVLFREKKDWQWIMKWMLAAAVLMILYGVGAGVKYFDAEYATHMVNGVPSTNLTGKGGPWFQAFGDFIGPSFKDPSFRFQGSIGNPAYVAAYLLFSLFYSFYLFVSAYKMKIRSWGGAFMLVLSAFFLVFFFLAATRGAFIGLGVSVLVALFYLGFSRPHLRKWVVGFGIALIVLAALLVFFQNSPIVKAIPGSRIFSISFNADTFSTRRIIWNSAWHGFLARPILGFGPENFLNVFSQYFDTHYFVPAAGFGAWFDRAHSIFFDYLAETGILGLISYFGIFVALYVALRRTGKANHPHETPFRQESLLARALIIALPVAYLVQGFILFDVLSIYFNIFLIFAFVVYESSSSSLSYAK